MRLHLPPFHERHVPADIVEAVIPAVGGIIVGFAFIETAIDTICLCLSDSLNSKPQKRLPYQLTEKLKFVERRLEADPALAGLRADVAEQWALIRQGAKFRNCFAHGALSHYTTEPMPLLIFAPVRYRQDEGDHVLEDQLLALADIMRLADDMPNITARLQELATRFADAISGEPGRVRLDG